MIPKSKSHYQYFLLMHHSIHNIKLKINRKVKETSKNRGFLCFFKVLMLQWTRRGEKLYATGDICYHK